MVADELLPAPIWLGATLQRTSRMGAHPNARALAEGGMLDVHDRRPIVLTADDARICMDLSKPRMRWKILHATSRCRPKPLSGIR